MKTAAKQIYTVSQVTSLIKEILENNLPGRVNITGEITDWKHHRQSGHCYFSLKDETALLPCVMWSSKFNKVKFAPENGLAVIAAGHIDIYPPQGKYQFYVDSMQPAGIGALQLAYEQMVKRLHAEGLFKQEHKKTLPRYPERIAVLTSESGAAIGDIENSIHNRWPPVKIFLYPVPVQGEGAAQRIAAAIKDVNNRNDILKLDLLIVGRGGGSLEDLWAFNEEVLARAIFDSTIPVISAVGHEIDTTIADWVADARASTPTKAGVTAVPDIKDISQQLAAIQTRLHRKVSDIFVLALQKLETILASSVFKNPLLFVNNAAQQLDEISSQLTESLSRMLTEIKQQLAQAYEKIAALEPHRLLSANTVALNNLLNRSASAITAVINKRRIDLTAYENRLAGLNPKSVLNRGYSITTDKRTGRLIRKPDQIQIGSLLITELAKKKSIESKVTKK